MAQKRDPNTLSNYHEIVTTQRSINFDIFFKEKRLVGNIVQKMKCLVDKCQSIILDSSYLDIQKIEVNDHPALWTLGYRVEPYGNPLTIQLLTPLSKGDEVTVDIYLSTTEKCTALQWLEPEQTPNKRVPYMFSQCQAIHARSIFPCQDTPDVKAPVVYCLRSPLAVVAGGHFSGEAPLHGGPWSAIGKHKGYKFEQRIPIPSYLVAIASGDLAQSAIGPRSAVWTGPEELEGCRWELTGVEDFIKAAEGITGLAYQWGTYNVLVLPNSFPYGGMENPIYTFATPTIISKDRQNVDVIAHEIAHSWSGNLVSNASWEHFWLNEGWTTYLERRIQAKVHASEAFRDFSAVIGWKALVDSIDRYGPEHKFTKLIIDLRDEDPDEAFSSIPYEKGSLFLYHLETQVGIEKWDRFINHYFRTYMLKSLDSYEFKACVHAFFAPDPVAAQKIASVDWDAWYHAPGYPPKPNFDTSMVEVCYALSDRWKDPTSFNFAPHAADIAGWTANQSVVFLERVQAFPAPPLRIEAFRVMGSVYGYAESSNVELVARYLSVGLMCGDKEVLKPTGDLLGRVGRMKFVRPLFKLLAQCDRQYAIEVFVANKNFYHPICRAMVERDLKI